MRVLQLVNIGYEAGGAEKSVHLLQSGLRSRGHEVLVVATDKELRGHHQFADVIIPRPAGGSLNRILRHSWNPTMSFEMRRIVSSFRPDIAHLHTIGDFSPSVFSALHKTPCVHTVHGPEEYTKALLPWHLPPSDYVHASYRRHELRLSGRIRLAYYRCVQRPLYLRGLRRLRLLIGPSAFMVRALEDDSGSVATRHVPNGIMLPDATPLGSQPNFLYVGRLEAVKGVSYLIRSMSQLVESFPAATLTVVGDGSHRSQLEALAEDLNLEDHVTFVGWVQGEQLDLQYRNSRVFVIPSIWPENMPTVAIEALAFARPMIGTNVGGIPELIEPGINGWIVEPADVDGLAAAMRDSLSDHIDLGALASASRRKADLFDIDAFLERVEHTYSEVLLGA
jgi:glycosyltransferase involved in cell wall biosynthesis